jgi:hypothetical protein
MDRSLQLGQASCRCYLVRCPQLLIGSSDAHSFHKLNFREQRVFWAIHVKHLHQKSFIRRVHLCE